MIDSRYDGSLPGMLHATEVTLAARLARSLVHELRTPLAIVRTELFNTTSLHPDLDLLVATDRCDQICAILRRVSALVHRRADLRPICLSALCVELSSGRSTDPLPVGRTVISDPGLLAEALVWLRSAFCRAFAVDVADSFPIRLSHARPPMDEIDGNRVERHSDRAKRPSRIGLLSPVDFGARAELASRFFGDLPYGLDILDAVLADTACMMANAHFVFEPPNEISIEFGDG